MKLQFKPEILNTKIYEPFTKTKTICKFIDVELYPYLYKKYPELFVIEVDKKKSKKINDNFINDTEQQSSSDIKGENEFN